MYIYALIVRHLIFSLHCRFENIPGIGWLQPRQTKLMFQVKCCRHHNLWGSEGSKQSTWSSYKAVDISAWQLSKFQQFKQTKQGSLILKVCCYITKIISMWTAVVYWDHSNTTVLQMEVHLCWCYWNFAWSAKSGRKKALCLVATQFQN